MFRIEKRRSIRVLREVLQICDDLLLVFLQTLLALADLGIQRREGLLRLHEGITRSAVHLQRRLRIRIQF